MKCIVSLTFFFLLAHASPAWSEQATLANEQLWNQASEAYGSGNTEAGHKHLRSLIEKNPGDVDLALKCLDKIRETAGWHDTNNPWVKYAVNRLCALERIGAISSSVGVHRSRLYNERGRRHHGSSAQRGEWMVDKRLAEHT